MGRKSEFYKLTYRKHTIGGERNAKKRRHRPERTRPGNLQRYGTGPRRR
jgi:hypothetical protein